MGIAIEFIIIQAFTFIAKSGVNPGVMASLFTSSIVFTSVIFYCKYGQKLTKWDVLGSTFIIGAAVIIGNGGAQSDSKVQSEA